MFGLWVVNLLSDLSQARDRVERLFEESRKLENVT